MALDSALSTPQRVAVIGGGLAGLSTTYHLLEKMPSGRHLSVEVFDKGLVGTAGASAVAGGLLHPLSPRGKLVHLGMEGLQATNYLLDKAQRSSADVGCTPESVVLRNELYRVAMTPNNVKQLQTTAQTLPELCEWVDSGTDLSGLFSEGDNSVLGALRMYNGCKVIHPPSYLSSLWAACESLADEKELSVSWNIIHGDDGFTESTLSAWKNRLKDFDAVVVSAGSGMFGTFLPLASLPIQLVRGQSLEMRIPSDAQWSKNALLCGKYVSPLADKDTVLVGATHEFQENALNVKGVLAELKIRTEGMVPKLWEQGVIQRMTVGYRVQSERGRHGRLPIVGRIPMPFAEALHRNAWVFSGLSSRGLLYHGIFGEALAGAVLQGNESLIHVSYPELAWWQKS
jgi:glycine/D-amino acid oxidase-like deaminating enzyme